MKPLPHPAGGDGRRRTLCCAARLLLAFLFPGALAAQEIMTVTVAGSAGAQGAVDGAGTAARFGWPVGVVVDTGGNVFIADSTNWVIRKLSPNGQVTTLAGLPGFHGHADGTGTSARFGSMEALAIDKQGNLYVGDNDSTIRKITPTGVVTTLAGVNGEYGSTNGTGSQARFRAPRGLAVDDGGNVFVSDAANRAIRKITPAGVVTTFAGIIDNNGSITGSGDGPGATARFGHPVGIVIDAAGNLYVVDSGYRAIRKITPQAVVSTLAGSFNNQGVIDGAGSSAGFAWPGAIALHPAGDLYVIEPQMLVIRRVTVTGAVTTIAGVAGLSGSADGRDNSVRFNWPGGIAIDLAGNWFIADTRNYTIRKRQPVFLPTLVRAPQNTTVTAGATAMLSVEATGTPAPTYQWRRNGVTIPGATAAALSIANVRADDAGSYSVEVTNIVGGFVTAPITLRVEIAPVIVTPPLAQSTPDGQPLVLTVNATSGLPESYRWQKNGVDISGATSATLTIPSAVPSHAGNYSVVVSNAAGAVTSSSAVVTILSSRFVNFSVRTRAGSGDATLIVGFVVSGSGKPLLVRGIGAFLAQYGVSDAMADPRVTIYRDNAVQGANDDWWVSTDANQIASVAESVAAFALPRPSRDAALLQTANSGAYTAHVSGVGESAGVALAEVYDANSTGEGRLANLSARALAGTGDNSLIAGFVITGNTKKQVLVRGAGPALSAFGVTGVLVNPRLTLVQNGITTIAANDDWNGSPSIEAAVTQVGAFPFARNSRDAALLVQLDPGAYTAQVMGADGVSGMALIEVYEVP